MHGTEPFQLELTYLPLFTKRRTSAERSASILRHKFQKHPLTPQFCAAVLEPRFAHEKLIVLQNHEAQHVKNMFENQFSFNNMLITNQEKRCLTS